MRIIEYELFPEAYASNGRFTNKNGSIKDLVIDTGMIAGSDYDKVIPSFETMNELFNRGFYPRSAEWNPFEITIEEYIQLIKELLELPLAKPYRIY